MILKMDCKGALDLTHSWSTKGHTCHIDVKWHWLREMKESGQILTEWIESEENPSDLFTKNLGGAMFKKHMAIFCSDE